MKQFLTFLLIFICLILQPACAKENNAKRNSNEIKSVEKQSPTIKEIKTIDDLLQKLTAQDCTIIMGSMDGCYYCKKVEPIFKKYAQEFLHIHFYTTNGLKTNMAQEVYKLDKKIKIKGYPSFIFIKDGKIHDYLLGLNIEELDKKIKALK